MMLFFTCPLFVVCFIGQDPNIQDEAAKALLKVELRRMVEKDQVARKKLIEWMKNSNQTDAEALKKREDLPEIKEVKDLDRKHTARLKEIVDKFGWPGKSLVGSDGAHDAWLLVQHADHDRAFQKRCLQLLEAAAKKDEVSKQDLAYLTDRVLVGEGKKQRYGTQFNEEKGEMVPQPIEDEANVDKRRADAGLPPLAEYKKMMEEVYKKKPKEK
jgi:hypothetical protein